MSTMEERYKVELRDRDPSTVEDLYLDNVKADEITGLGSDLKNLKVLSIINVGLKTLKGLPSLPSLQQLNLTENQLNGDLDVIVKQAPDVMRLSLSHNKFDSIEQLRPLKMSKIVELELNNNGDLAQSEDFRKKIFEMIPSLEVLDGVNVDGEEVDEEEFDGEGAEDSDEGDSDEEEGPGLSYLDNSQLDEDETEDYNPDEEDEPRGTKRSAGDTDNEPEVKKAASGDA